jgi:hypothetical protein
MVDSVSPVYQHIVVYMFVAFIIALLPSLQHHVANSMIDFRD